jgi:hypothetical protein
MEIASFETFLAERIKVGGKAGALGDLVKVTHDKTKVTVTSEVGGCTSSTQFTRCVHEAPAWPGFLPVTLEPEQQLTRCLYVSAWF